jgi:sulfur dioxygenase
MLTPEAKTMIHSKIDQLKPTEVQMIIDEDPHSITIIDVREPWEYASDTGHVIGSRLIPMNEIPENLEELRKLSASKKLGIICNSGQRSYYTAAFLKQNGINNVFNIDGGIIQWILSGLEVEYGSGTDEK